MSTNLSGFPQGSIIGPSLVNFALNGLESTIKDPGEATRVSLKKKKWLEAISAKSLINNDLIRLIVRNNTIRYADDFIIVTNSSEEIPFLKKKVEKFLSKRGLKASKTRSKVIKWNNNSKFDFLGFTFHYLTTPYPSKVTMQGARGIAIRGGLYTYPSDDSVKAFKVKTKKLIQSNINASPAKLIRLLNPIIRD